MIVFLYAPHHGAITCAITSAASFVSCKLFLFSLTSVLTGLPGSTVGTGSTSSNRLSKTRGKRVRESPDFVDQDPDVTDEPAGSSHKRARTELAAKVASSTTVLQTQVESAALGQVQASEGRTAAPQGL